MRSAAAVNRSPMTRLTGYAPASISGHTPSTRTRFSPSSRGSSLLTVRGYALRSIQSRTEAVRMETWPGNPQPLGAVFDGAGTNFALFSEVASRVELCLFDSDGRETRIELPERTGYVWHGYLPRVGPGQRYGYRVH